MWYKVTITSEDEKSPNSLLQEVFLIQAESYTDCEKRAYELLAEGRSGFNVKRIQLQKIREFFISEEPSEELKYYRVRVRLEIFNERSQKISKSNIIQVVSGVHVEETINTVRAAMGQIEFYDIAEITLMDVSDVYPLPSEADE